MKSTARNVSISAAGFLLGAVTVYLCALADVTLLPTNLASGLLVPIIVCPLVGWFGYRRTLKVQDPAVKRSRIVLVVAFAVGCVFMALLWIYMVVSLLGPLANFD